MAQALQQYTTLKRRILKAKEWKKHLTATGRNSERARIHDVGANPSICIQYTTGGQNYWDAKAEVGEEFVRKLNDVLARSLGTHIDETIRLMESDLEKLKEEAMAEYTQLFGEEAA